jgi:hypothetical protein
MAQSTAMGSTQFVIFRRGSDDNSMVGECNTARALVTRHPDR